MYSQSNSFLGGANAGRPGQPQYGQAQQQYGQPQQGFAPQPTGYGGGLQPQMTGYPGAQQQQISPQYTGYPGQPQGMQQQQQPPPMPPMPTGFQPQQQPQQQQPMQTGMPQVPQQPQPQPQQPQPTGMTSAQMANSFRSSPAPAAPQAAAKSTSSKIPSIRLSFITAQDQAKFEQLFKSAVGNNQALSGEQARDILLRSKLPGDTLSEIWLLSDTTKSGQLLFPEFALAMYLCNLKMNGQSIPGTLPDKIKNEVSSMVDIISFGAVDDTPQAQQMPSNVPNFDAPKQTSFANPSAIQQPQAQQPTNSQLLSTLVSQPTGFMAQPSFQVSQPTGMAPQQTGFGMNPQATGYNGPRPPMPPMPTGFQQPTAPLNAQPTGRPGQWGLVNAPASGLPNIEALGAQMMPQAGREGGFTSTGLRGNATVPWAITKDEKKIYDNLFRSWDGLGKGYITGSQGIEILGQSGLEKADLERIWTLADPGNKGRLDLDEFAVAMHLIYRRLNGYPVPNQLPPELVPPSTRNLTSTLGNVKSMLQRDAEERKGSVNYLEPQKTGVSYLKNRSFTQNNNGNSFGRKDATVFKNDDNNVGYRSSARHRVADDGRSPSPQQSSSPAPEDMTLDQLRKKIREKQVMLDALDFQDENAAEQDEVLDRKDRRDAEELYRRIRRLQEDIDSHPAAAFGSGGSEAERRTMKRQLQGLTDRLPELASQARRTEKSIADARVELFRIKDAKANPGSGAPIVGTGPGGAVTESDRLKARAKAMMQQRAAALSGKPAPPTNGGDDAAAATRRLEEESSRVKGERESNDRMVGDVEESVKVYSQSVEESLKAGGQNSSSEHERRRWDEGLGVEDEVRDFIFDLQRSSRSARLRKDESRKPVREAPSSRGLEDGRQGPGSRVESPAPSASPAPRSGTASPAGSYNAYKTPEERAAFIKQQAEARMAERMAALGLRAPAKAGETAQQRQQQETEARRKQAEEEDAKREQERQRRLADETVTPPTASKKPPPPPTRKGAAAAPQKQAELESKRQSREIAETALQEQQQAQQAELSRLEDEEKRQEDELRREKEASEARRKALEEQVRQGKIKKEEEKRRRKAEKEETRLREERLAAQRAEIEAARKQEEELQRQLEAMNDEDDSSSDDEGPQQIDVPGVKEVVSSPPPAAPPIPSFEAPAASVPAASTTTAAAAPAAVPAIKSPESAASPAAPASEATTNNPFFKRMQSSDQAPSAASVTSPPQSDTNPFHRMTAQATGTNPARQTPKPDDDDDWSNIDSDKDDSDDESNRGTAGGAKQLASILFGTMGPPRPMSSMGDKDSVKSPASPPPVVSSPVPPPAPPPLPDTGAPAAPPPPPPMPTMNGSSAPPPPPPPPPPGGFPASPPPPPPAPPAPGLPTQAPTSSSPAIGALLGDITKGKALKKVQTRESENALAGRVL